jgi:hypothetical protein
VTGVIVLVAVAAVVGFVWYWSGRYGDRNRSKGTSLRRGPRSHTTATGQAKRGYATRHEAEGAAQSTAARGGVDLSVYRCGTCEQWHVGH